MLAHASYDVLVVGARCAGAAAAMLLARRGLSVLAIDRADYGTDTVSTHALMRGGVLQLHRWGVLPWLRRQALPAIRTTTFHYDDEAVPIAIRPAHGVEALYAPRRTLLDSVLADAAERAGATVRHGYTLTRLLHRPDGRVCGATVLDAAGKARTIKADLVVGADGIGSSVARLTGAPIVREARNTSAVVYGHFPDLALAGSHWWFRAGVSAGAIPTNYGRHCVFVAMPPARLRSALWRDDRMAAFREVLVEADPELASSVARSTPDAPLRVFAGRKGYLRQACGPGWALVGDAGYFKDPLTAHGITDALRDAELLANAAGQGSDAAFAEYAATRDALSLPLFEVTDAIAGFDWDTGQVKALHHTLNQAMKREVEHLLTLDEARTPEIEEAVL